MVITSHKKVANDGINRIVSLGLLTHAGGKTELYSESCQLQRNILPEFSFCEAKMVYMEWYI